jgi:hypothetical protein
LTEASSGPTSNIWSRRTWAALLFGLSLLTVLVHGYHPLAEDGGLYVAGVEYTLNHALFPHYTGFVREHLGYSLFAPMVAAIVQLTHLSLGWVLLFVDLFSVWLTLFAARQLLRRCITSEPAQLAGIALLGAWWTMPVASTALLLMDPYVTARSLSTPLSILAIAFALDDWSPARWLASSLRWCGLFLAIAAALHPLMATYALAFVIVVRASRLRRRALAWAVLAAAATVVAAAVQAFAPPESPALLEAILTRSYWFLSQWQWYELFGLAGPLIVLAAILRWRNNKLSSSAHVLCQTCFVLGMVATFNVLLFAHESASVHLLAKLQLLRIYLLIYAVMIMLLGASFWQLSSDAGKRVPSLQSTLRFLSVALILSMAAVMYFVQRQDFPASTHVELPWRADRNTNPWVQAFFWIRQNTPQDALFALDARYINTEGEDAQTFRAIALRSAIPDFSKDGGEASITPSLALLWQQGARVQKGLSGQNDTMRDPQLRSLGATWMVLHSAAVTVHPCPYDNGTVKVCQLTNAR